MWLGWAVVVSIIFGTLRAALPGSGLDFRDTFKDLAHVWVGLLLGGALVASYYKLPPRATLWALFVLLCVVEVCAALLKG